MLSAKSNIIDHDSVKTPQLLLTRITSYFSINNFVDPCPFQKHFDPKKHICGLSFQWKKHIYFVNPPYSKAKKFVLYACDQHIKHNTRIIMLVKTSVISTKYFKKVAPHCSLVLIPGRIQFPTFNQAARFGNILVCFGFANKQTFDVLSP